MVLSFSEGFLIIKPLLFFIVGMVIYSIFIFKFYRFVAERDIFNLNLRQYNKVKHPVLEKVVHAILYLIEYIFLFPIFILLWFSVLIILLSFLTQNQTIRHITLISMAIVGVIRITAYYSEDLSKDLAKMLPFALLAIFIVDYSTLSFSSSIDVVKGLTGMIKTIIYYIIFVFLIEITLRTLKELNRK